MANGGYKITIDKDVGSLLDGLADRSIDSAHDVGALLAKAESFDASGIAKCSANHEVRYVGQYEVLPIQCRSLRAFVELREARTRGEIFFVAEVGTFAELRLAWQRVYAYFGYECPQPTPPQKDWRYNL